MVGPENEPVRVRAVSRYARVAPNKARQVITHIRGRQVDDARRILELSPKGVARQILKTLDSAVANAENNNGLDPDDLIVARAVVDEGPTMKRYQPRALGRAYQIRKRTSHIEIVVGAKQAEPAPAGRARRRAAAGSAEPAAGSGNAASSEE